MQMLLLQVEAVTTTGFSSFRQVLSFILFEIILLHSIVHTSRHYRQHIITLSIFRFQILRLHISYEVLSALLKQDVYRPSETLVFCPSW